MNSGPRFASRSFKLVALGLAVSALSTMAMVAAAQQRPNELRSVNDDATLTRFAGTSNVPSTHAVAATHTVVTKSSPGSVVESRILTSGEVSSTSNRASVASTPGHHRVPMVTDWSTKHVVFAKPRTESEAARMEHNTRYRQQVLRRNAPTLRKLVDAQVDREGSTLLDRFRNRVNTPHPLPAKANAARRDWSVDLNGTGVNPSKTPSVGDNQFPAKFSFDINEPITTDNCTTDFVVYNTNTSLLVAFNNLYSGADIGLTPALCSGGAPNVLWAYNVNSFTDGVTSTSVSLSEDGSTVMFVESSLLSGSVLHILKPGTGGSIATPATLTLVTDPAVWEAGCTACMWSVRFAQDPSGANHPLGGGGPVFAPDSNSAPFYDFDTDIVYVGDDAGYIHQFVNVLNGGMTAVPTESTGANFPIYTNSTVNPALTGPIFDANSGRLFVADQFGDLIYIETGLGTTTPGPCVGQPGPTYTYPCLPSNGNYNSGTNGIPDPPVVDSSLGTVMVFAGGSGTGDNAFVAQAPTTGACVCGTGEITGDDFVYQDFGPVSGGGGGVVMHSGDFDNSYYESDGAAGSVAGFMYVCAIDPLGATLGFGNTALRQLAFNADGVISGVSSSYLQVGTDPYDECSPVTEVYNPTGGVGQTPIDLMFFSVQVHSTACLGDGTAGVGYSDAAPAGGCLMSFNVTGDTALPTPVSFTTLVAAGFAAHLAEDGGTSGIIVDNVSTDAQASSIYFTPLGYATDPGDTCTFIGCAVKATQVGLQ